MKTRYLMAGLLAMSVWSYQGNASIIFNSHFEKDDTPMNTCANIGPAESWRTVEIKDATGTTKADVIVDLIDTTGGATEGGSINVGALMHDGNDQAPELNTLYLMGWGLAGIAYQRRRSRKAALALAENHHRPR